MTRAKLPGFTLIELIVVIAIIAVLLAFLVPAANNMLHGNALSGASQILTDRLALARQTAVARNRTIEVRFYKYSDPLDPGSLDSVRAFQSFEMDNGDVFVPLEKFQALPPGIIIDSGTSISSLASLITTPTESGTGTVPPKISATYFTVHFLPDGSTDLLATSDWFFTLHQEIYHDNLKLPPANFITIDIDPVAGTLKTFRPGS